MIDLVLCSSQVLLVVTPEPTSITDAYALLKTLQRQEEFEGGKMKIHMISNRTQSEDEGRELYRKLSAVSSKFLQMEMEYLGSVPHDFQIAKCRNAAGTGYDCLPECTGKQSDQSDCQTNYQPTGEHAWSIYSKRFIWSFCAYVSEWSAVKGEYVMKNILIVDDSALMQKSTL